MGKQVPMICIIIGILGCLAAVLSFAAEAERVKATQVNDLTTSPCVFPSSPAMATGLTAAVALIIAQTVINIATGCLCCRNEQFQFSTTLIAALLCSSISWFTFSAAILLLLIGVALNFKYGEESIYHGDYSCYVVKSGVFAAAAVLSLITVVLGILSYIMVESDKKIVDGRAPADAPGQPGIPVGQVQLPQQPGATMGQAQLPQQRSQVAENVHDDSYMRREIELV